MRVELKGPHYNGLRGTARRSPWNSGRPPSGPFLSLLTGSFSTPAADDPTVAMVEAAYRHHGINARYLNCDVAPAALDDAVRGARAMGWAGFNCSLPHKAAVIEHLDGLGASAAVIGSVDCVVARGNRLVGENTDGQGFVASLRRVVDPRDRTLVVLGAGGAARAVAVEAAFAGVARITIVDRDARRGGALAAFVEDRTPARASFVAWDGSYRVPGATDILVNATPVGLGDADAVPAVDTSTLRTHLVVADLIPNPPRTRLLRAAELHGCRTLDGQGMLVAQVAIAIEHWTGVHPDTGVMRRELARVAA